MDVVFKGRSLPAGPWVFKKRLQRPGGEAAPPGAYVGVRDPDGRLLGRGLYNRRSEIALRVLGGPEAPDNLRDLLRERLDQALHLREETLGLQRHTDAYRLINAEGDGLSGLVVDRYGNTCVASVYALGWINAAEMLETTLLHLQDVDRVLFRADQRTQKLEGFRLPDPEPGQETTVREGRLKFRVDLSEGHKTGLFLDQRDNRARVASLCRGRTVLDLCTNAGAFALSCRGPGRSGAVTAVDLDERALEAAKRNAKLNDLRVRFEHADLFPWLRDRVESGDRWDAVVLDPPKLAAGPKDVDKACVRYRDMNRLAFQVCAAGAIMATCSCSGAVSEGQFLGAVRAAAQQAGRRARVLELSGPAPDHPIALDFPEGRYLKVALLHVE